MEFTTNETPYAVRILADALALLYHEARHVRFLIRAGHRPPQVWASIVSIPKNRVDAWHLVQDTRQHAAELGTADLAADAFRSRFGVTLGELLELFGDPHWKHAAAVGGHAWRAVAEGTTELHDALVTGDHAQVSQRCARVLEARHNNGTLREKIIGLDRAIGITTGDWWLRP